MSVEEFEKEVKIITNKSKLQSSAVTNIVKLAMLNITSDAQLVSTLFRSHKKSSPINKLSSLYLLDAISREAKSKSKKSSSTSTSSSSKDIKGKSKEIINQEEEIISPVEGEEKKGTFNSFLSKIEGLLGKLIMDSWENGLPEHREKIHKVLDIWTKGETFNVTTIGRIKSKLATMDKISVKVSAGDASTSPSLSKSKGPSSIGKESKSGKARSPPPPTKLNYTGTTEPDLPPGSIPASVLALMAVVSKATTSASTAQFDYGISKPHVDPASIVTPNALALLQQALASSSSTNLPPSPSTNLNSSFNNNNNNDYNDSYNQSFTSHQQQNYNDYDDNRNSNSYSNQPSTSTPSNQHQNSNSNSYPSQSQSQTRSESQSNSADPRVRARANQQQQQQQQQFSNTNSYHNETSSYNRNNGNDRNLNGPVVKGSYVRPESRNKPNNGNSARSSNASNSYHLRPNSNGEEENQESNKRPRYDYNYDYSSNSNSNSNSRNNNGYYRDRSLSPIPISTSPRREPIPTRPGGNSNLDEFGRAIRAVSRSPPPPPLSPSPDPISPKVIVTLSPTVTEVKVEKFEVSPGTKNSFDSTSTFQIPISTSIVTTSNRLIAPPPPPPAGSIPSASHSALLPATSTSTPVLPPPTIPDKIIPPYDPKTFNSLSEESWKSYSEYLEGTVGYCPSNDEMLKWIMSGMQQAQLLQQQQQQMMMYQQQQMMFQGSGSEVTAGAGGDIGEEEEMDMEMEMEMEG